MSRRIALLHRGRALPLQFEMKGSHAALRIDDRVVEATLRREGAWVEVREKDRTIRCAVVAGQRGIWVACEGNTYILEHHRADAVSAAALSTDELRAPMTGRVVSVAAKEGIATKEGDLLVTIEAMKMEFRLSAPEDGTVVEVHCKEGDRVDLGQLLLSLKPAVAPPRIA